MEQLPKEETRGLLTVQRFTQMSAGQHLWRRLGLLSLEELKGVQKGSAW